LIKASLKRVFRSRRKKQDIDKECFVMKVTWIGQAGLLIEMNGLQIMVDPYLSDCVEKVNPASYRRKPVDTALFDVEPDVMLFTHDHIDHYDPETAPHFYHHPNWHHGGLAQPIV
jgi:L-ascorbate metabolism protein UlaG (beta-lactamase superfamily)